MPTRIYIWHNMSSTSIMFSGLLCYYIHCYFILWLMWELVSLYPQALINCTYSTYEIYFVPVSIVPNQCRHGSHCSLYNEMYPYIIIYPLHSVVLRYVRYVFFRISHDVATTSPGMWYLAQFWLQINPFGGYLLSLSYPVSKPWLQKVLLSWSQNLHPKRVFKFSLKPLLLILWSLELILSCELRVPFMETY